MTRPGAKSRPRSKKTTNRPADATVSAHPDPHRQPTARHRHAGNFTIRFVQQVAAFNEGIPGPVIEADERFMLTHPEHANHSFPAGVWQVTYQMDARSQRRVED